MESINVFDKRNYRHRNEIVLYDNYAEIILYKSKMEQVEISRALISLDKVDLVKHHKWGLTNHGYVATDINNKRVLLHKIITNTSSDILIDHRSGNKLDNRNDNLRIADKQKNAMNSKIPNTNSSGVKGVSFHAKRNKWRAYIKLNNEQIWLGYHVDVKDAIKARKDAEIKYFGEWNKSE